MHGWGSLHPRSISELGAVGEDRCRVAEMRMCLSHGLVMEFVSPRLVPSPQLPWLSPQPLGLPLQIDLIGIFLATHNLSSSKAPSKRGQLVQAGSGRTWPPSIQGWMHYMGASWTEEGTSKLGTMRSEGFPGYEQFKSIGCRWGSCSSEEQACRGQCWEGTSAQGPRRGGGGGTGTQKQSKAEQGGHKRGAWPEAGRQGPGAALWTAMPGLGCGSQTDGGVLGPIPSFGQLLKTHSLSLAFSVCGQVVCEGLRHAMGGMVLGRTGQDRPLPSLPVGGSCPSPLRPGQIRGWGLRAASFLNAADPKVGTQLKKSV